MFIFQKKSWLGEFTLWEQQKIAKVQALSDDEVLRGLEDIMLGRNYSWHNIACRLQVRLNAGLLQLESFEPGNILYEWNVLCDEKIEWQRRGCPSFKSFKFNRASLTNLLIIPTQAGLGFEGKLSTHTYFETL